MCLQSGCHLWYVSNAFLLRPKFIHVTTPEVYGSTKLKIKENLKFNPSTPYAISRAATDMHLIKYYEMILNLILVDYIQ